MLNDYNVKNIYYMVDILCNERCSKCSHWKSKSIKADITAKEIYEFINGFSNAHELCIVGGEPLIYKSLIMEIISNINPDIRIVVITNGVLCDSDFVDFLQDKNIHLIFSIDTLDKEYWKFIRGNDTYDKVINNLNYAISKLDTDKISIQSVRAKETLGELPNISEYCCKNDIYHSIQDYVQDGFDGKWSGVVNNSEIAGNSNLEESDCYAYDGNLSIMPDGRVFTCFQQELIKGFEVPIYNIKNKIEIDSGYLNDLVNSMKKCNLPCKVLKCNEG